MRATGPLLAMIACLFAGCTHVSTVATSGAATTTTATSASVAVSSNSAGALVLVGIWLIAMEASNPVRPLNPRPPELDPQRRVNEVDCTRPIADWSANLKCK
jgi:hypothetical protein